VAKELLASVTEVKPIEIAEGFINFKSTTPITAS
jgi:hypothetical protein